VWREGIDAAKAIINDEYGEPDLDEERGWIWTGSRPASVSGQSRRRLIYLTRLFLRQTRTRRWPKKTSRMHCRWTAAVAPACLFQSTGAFAPGIFIIGFCREKSSGLEGK